MKKNFKYTIHGFQQDKLVECKLTNDDALVASVILSMYASSSMQSAYINGERYIWVSQRSLHRYIPIVGSEKKVRRIIDSLISKGLLEKEVARNKSGKGGMYTFVKPTPKLGELTEYNHSSEGDGQDVQEVLVKTSSGDVVKMSSTQWTECQAPSRQNVQHLVDKTSSTQWTKCPNKDSPNKDTPNSDTPNSYSKGTQSVAKNIEKKNSKKAIVQRLIDNGVSEELAEEYWHYRVTIKKDRPTDRAITMLINECKSNNFDLSDAIDVMIARGWKGFRYQWLLNERGGNNMQRMSKREAVEANNNAVTDLIKEQILRGEF